MNCVRQVARTGLTLCRSHTRPARQFSSREWPSPVRRPSSGWGREKSQRPGTYIRFGPKSGPGGPRRSPSLYVGVAASGLVFGGIGIYYWAHVDYAPYTNRRRMIDTPMSFDLQIGDEVCKQKFQEYRGRILSPRAPETVILKRIGKRLAAAAEETFPEIVEHFQWRFVVVDDPNNRNAFCIPGGKVFVFTGLLDIMESEDALASIVAHEVGHAIARHGSERIAMAKLAFVFYFLLWLFFDQLQIASIVINLALALPYSRKIEREADVIGLYLMTAACFDPNECPNAFQALAKEGHQEPVEFLSTHPATKGRIQEMKKMLPEVQKKYDEKCQKADDFFDMFGRNEGWSPYSRRF